MNQTVSNMRELAQREAAGLREAKRLRLECEARGGHDLGPLTGPFTYSSLPEMYERKCRHCGVVVMCRSEEKE